MRNLRVTLRKKFCAALCKNFANLYVKTLLIPRILLCLYSRISIDLIL